MRTTQGLNESANPVGRQCGQREARSAWWLYSDFVIDGTLNPLFATEISFGCLNRNVTEQKLDLLQFPSRGVAKPCTRPAVMPHTA